MAEATELPNGQEVETAPKDFDGFWFGQPPVLYVKGSSETLLIATLDEVSVLMEFGTSAAFTV